MTNPDDRAIVIGIRRYADTASGWITNLNGPDNDAVRIAEWLTRADGGGLPPDNVRVVRSADLPDPFPDDGVGPAQRAVEDAFNDVAKLPATTFEGQYAGRRLYVYVSGHGYAKTRDEAAVITAEAEKDRPVNVLVTSWVDWLYHAALFKEIVLWVDTCAVRTPLAVLTGCDRNPKHSPNASSVRMFAAFAAGIDKRAVENQMPDGEWHGVFTYALLQGLSGAAASPVTSASLRGYLHNNMATFMREDQRESSTVALEPAFGRTDDIVFAAPPRPTFPVRLQFSQECMGRRATVSVPPLNLPVAETVLQQAEWVPHVEAGVYGVFVRELGLSKAFLVSGGGDDAVVTVP